MNIDTSEDFSRRYLGRANPTSISEIGINSYDELWDVFLLISPSFSLAGEILHLSGSQLVPYISDLYSEYINAGFERANGKLPRGEQRWSESMQVMVHFPKILKTRKEHIPSMTWWDGGLYFPNAEKRARTAQIASDSTNLIENLPTTNPIAYLNTKEDETVEKFFSDIERFILSVKSAETWPEALIVALPLAIPKKQLLEFIASLIDEYSDPNVIPTGRTARVFAGKRLRFDPLMNKLKLLMYKAFHPHEPLWRLGLRAGISRTYSRMFDHSGSKRILSEDEKARLAIITSRALSNAKYIAENAAAGTFPSSKRTCMPNYDWDAIRGRLLTRWPLLKVDGGTT